MTALTFTTLLAEIGDNFPRSGPRLGWSDLQPYGIAIVVAVLAAFIVVQLRKRNDMTEICNKPWKLFRELCQAHGLDGSNQRLLASVAAARQFEQPAEVFVRPEALTPEGLPPSLRSRAEQLDQLRRRLFA